MGIYIENRQTDPYYNLALEQAVFDRLGPGQSCFMFWQNDNAIIIGKHQNTAEEINAAFVKEHNITVARRLSGGGAVYHDLGNLNFTFIAPLDNRQNFDFAFFCEPVRRALLSLGVPVEISGRNDMTVEGKKFSGNAQYIKENKIMHHGTILFDSSLDIISNALMAKEKIESRAIKSTNSRVTNIRPYLGHDMDIDVFRTALKNSILPFLDMQETEPVPEYHETAMELREKVYSRWDWNYGNSPPHTRRKSRRIEGCGTIEIYLDMETEGRIKNIFFHGDFFGYQDPAELAVLLTGRRLEYSEIKSALNDIDVSRYFHALDMDGFLELLFE